MKKFEEIKEIVDKLSNRKQETLIQGLRECQLKDIEHPFITKKEYIDKLLNYIKDLQQKVEQLENIRKEVIEWVNKHKEQLHHSWDEPNWNYLLYGNADDLLNILNKGSDKE